MTKNTTSNSSFASAALKAVFAFALIAVVSSATLTTLPKTTHAIKFMDVLDPFHVIHEKDKKKSKKPVVTAANKLTVSCSADDTTVSDGDYVHWTASVSGGNNTYLYTWRGTDNLAGSTRSISKMYTSGGYKDAFVRVTSAGQAVDIQCSNSVYVREGNGNNGFSNNSNLRVTCSADDDLVEEDDRVEWSAHVSGGRAPYSYDWSGTNGLSGSERAVNKRYQSTGTKRAFITVTDDRGDQITADCDELEVVRDERAYDRQNDYYDDSSYYNNGRSLSLSCYPSTSSVNAGGRVSWIASASGITNGISYSWSGTDSVNGSGSNLTVQYNSPGTKNMTVTARTSRGEVASASCGTIGVIGSVAPVVYSTPIVNTNAVATADLDVKCSANQSSARVDESVVWTAEVKGGNGTYSYKWMGADELSGNQAVLVKSYKSEGDKFAMVTVTSGSKSTNVSCSPVVKVGGSVSGLGAAAFLGAGLSWAAIGVIVVILLFFVIAYVLYNKEKIK